MRSIRLVRVTAVALQKKAHYQCLKAYRGGPFYGRHQCFTSTLWEV